MLFSGKKGDQNYKREGGKRGPRGHGVARRADSRLATSHALHRNPRSHPLQPSSGPLGPRRIVQLENTPYNTNRADYRSVTS